MGAGVGNGLQRSQKEMGTAEVGEEAGKREARGHQLGRSELPVVVRLSG